MTRVAVLAARRRVLLFYVETFHIRDALRAEAAGLGLDALLLMQAVALILGLPCLRIWRTL